MDCLRLILSISKPTGPAEFLPILLALTPRASSEANADPLTTSLAATSVNLTPAPIGAADLLPFLNDLAAGFSDDVLADVITPTISLFFQEWFKISPSPDLLGDEWRRYLGAVATLVQVKRIAALVRGCWYPDFPALTLDVSATYTLCMGRAGRGSPQARMAVFVGTFDKIERLSSGICEYHFIYIDVAHICSPRYGKPTSRTRQSGRRRISMPTNPIFGILLAACMYLSSPLAFSQLTPPSRLPCLLYIMLSYGLLPKLAKVS